MSIATVAARPGEAVLPFDLTPAKKPVFSALVDARNRFGGSTAALVDGDERVLSYDELVRASLALGHALRKGTKPGESVAIMLPSGAAAVIAFFGVSPKNSPNSKRSAYQFTKKLLNKYFRRGRRKQRSRHSRSLLPQCRNAIVFRRRLTAVSISIRAR